MLKKSKSVIANIENFSVKDLIPAKNDPLSCTHSFGLFKSGHHEGLVSLSKGRLKR
jgi:hypothetical protein